MNKSTISVDKKRIALNDLQTIVKNTKVNLPKDYGYKDEYKKWMSSK